MNAGFEITAGYHCGGETFQSIFSRIGWKYSEMSLFHSDDQPCYFEPFRICTVLLIVYSQAMTICGNDLPVEEFIFEYKLQPKGRNLYSMRSSMGNLPQIPWLDSVNNHFVFSSLITWLRNKRWKTKKNTWKPLNTPTGEIKVFFFNKQIILGHKVLPLNF